MPRIQILAESVKQEEELQLGQKVVIIGDDRDLRGILLYALDSYGYQPIFFENGTDALLNATIEAFDYLLIDCDMPGMDGLALTGRLREIFPLAIIIGMSKEDRGVAFLRAGANDFLRKPFVPYSLAMMISGRDILA
jgi:two-component system chemotaxis response regulator CheY